MLNLDGLTELITKATDFYRHFVPPGWVPYPNLMAIGVVAVGILLAFWGARLLRTIYILGFMVMGAAVGFRLGSYWHIDTLVGLTFGAGLAGLAAYILFRWWVGVTAGTVAALVVLALAWPKLVPLNDSYQGFGRGEPGSAYLVGNGDEQRSVVEYVAGLSVYVWTQHRDFAWRFVFAASMAWLLGVVLGLVLPKFTTIMGTSLLGVLLVSVGAAVVLCRNWPEIWTAIIAHPDWYLVGMGALLIVSTWRQTRAGRTPAAAPAAPPPAEAPAAPAK
jgi:hypothetical protein